MVRSAATADDHADPCNWPSFGGWSRYWKRCVSFDSRQGTHEMKKVVLLSTTLKQFINREMDWLMWFASLARRPRRRLCVAPPDPARSTNINCGRRPFRTSKLQMVGARRRLVEAVFDVFF